MLLKWLGMPRRPSSFFLSHVNGPPSHTPPRSQNTRNRCPTNAKIQPLLSSYLYSFISASKSTKIIRRLGLSLVLVSHKRAASFISGRAPLAPGPKINAQILSHAARNTQSPHFYKLIHIFNHTRTGNCVLHCGHLHLAAAFPPLSQPQESSDNAPPQAFFRLAPKAKTLSRFLHAQIHCSLAHAPSGQDPSPAASNL